MTGYLFSSIKIPNDILSTRRDTSEEITGGLQRLLPYNELVERLVVNTHLCDAQRKIVHQRRFVPRFYPVVASFHCLQELVLDSVDLENDTNCQILFEGLANLKLLHLSHSDLTETRCRFMCALPLLETLVLDSCIPQSILHRVMGNIAQIPTLRCLGIVSTYMTDETFAHLTKLPSLKKLESRYWNCTSRGPFSFTPLHLVQSLEEFSSIDRRRIYSQSLINDVMFHIAKCHRLKALAFERCEELAFSHSNRLTNMEKLIVKLSVIISTTSHSRVYRFYEI